MKPSEAKINATLPKVSDRNGLHSIAPQLVTDPEALRYAVVLLDTGSVQTSYEIDEFGERYEVVVPSARIRAIEPLDGADARAAARLMDTARGARMGELPYLATASGPFAVPGEEP